MRRAKICSSRKFLTFSAKIWPGSILYREFSPTGGFCSNIGFQYCCALYGPGYIKPANPWTIPDLSGYPSAAEPKMDQEL
jgi:hypothetical protein